MVSGVLIGFLTEQHADYIARGDGIRITLAAGLILDRFDSGTLVSIDYLRDSDDVRVVQGMKRASALRPYSAR
jgi:hypothetical protein